MYESRCMVSFIFFSKKHHKTKRKILADKLSSLEALISALANLDKVCETIEDEYLNSLIENKFERWEEKS